MAESPIVTASAPTDDHSDTFPASSAAEIQHEDPTSGLGVEASLVDSNRSGDGRQAAAGEHTSHLLLPRAELRKLREVDNQERDADARVLFVTKSLCVVVVNFSYGALLAYFADHVFGARIGMVVVYLNPVFTAGLAGYALAERRRSDGTERSADNFPVFSEEEEEYASNFVFFSGAMISLPCNIARVLLWHLAD
ncbi:hypothetical protein E2562_035670 [Oryza meyeriana var. granulata]|uniref:Uncharacterized protein n=1 Tax=Oryza meyeriana var. granulata TaxID=110450 RepID=A0A6G1E7C4_9ORYZ|nr:hypothetical protein E2562_035670 [Oryza meyeriana var. granulata]